MLRTVFTENDRLSYNELGEVEATYSMVREHQEFDDFLVEFASLAYEHGLTEKVGAFLLHRHFMAEPEKVLVEVPQQVEGGRIALVTSPRAVVSSDDYTSFRWRLSSGSEFTPLEFTADPAAARVLNKLAQLPEFIDGYSEMLRKYGLEDLLGLCITDKESLKPTRNEWLVEYNRPDASVVIIERMDKDESQGLIPTVWVASVREDARGYCRPAGICQGTCRIVGSGSHTYEHRRVNQGHDRS